jgi:hypothetical protein
MREAYVTTRDALGTVYAQLYARKGTHPRAPKLWYLEDDVPVSRGLTGQALDTAVNRLAIIFPDRVH